LTSIVQFTLLRSASIALSVGTAVKVVHGGSSCPAVMLSPNAVNLVALSVGACVGVTVTPKEHAAVCCRASRAEQVTTVGPTGKSDPLDGVQLIATFPSPPVTVGAPKVIGTAWPSGDCPVSDPGQPIARRPDGPVGPSPHAAAIRLAARASAVIEIDRM
jgi:hypothetical protein